MALTLVQKAALRAELQNDPLGRGYAGMSVGQKENSLNTVDRPAPDKDHVSGSQIFNAIVPGEFSALLTTQQGLVRDVFGLGDRIDVRAGTNARQVMLNAFSAATTTRANLIELVTTLQSRAQELLGTGVTVTDVTEALSS